jgi:hypothetical protein
MNGSPHVYRQLSKCVCLPTGASHNANSGVTVSWWARVVPKPTFCLLAILFSFLPPFPLQDVHKNSTQPGVPTSHQPHDQNDTILDLTTPHRHILYSIGRWNDCEWWIFKKMFKLLWTILRYCPSTWGSSVSMETWLRAWTIGVQLPADEMMGSFLFDTASSLDLGSTHPPILWVLGGSFFGGKVAGEWSRPLTSNCAVVDKAWSYTSILPIRIQGVLSQCLPERTKEVLRTAAFHVEIRKWRSTNKKQQGCQPLDYDF